MIECDYEWIPISEKEYNEAYNKECPKGDNKLINMMNEILFNAEYRKNPIYKISKYTAKPGFLPEPEIMGYKYYKKGELKFYIVGSLEQIKEQEKQFNKMMLNYIK